MNKVLKLQRVGLVTPTVVEYEGKVLAINHLDVESTCNLWRVHFGFYPTEKVDLVMTKKQFLSIQQKTLSSVKSVYELFYERNFIPREFEANEEPAEWGMYRNKEIEELKAENAELKSSLTHANEECLKWHERAQNLLKDSGGSISGYEKKISDLQAENAALRERLKKAVDKELIAKELAEIFDCPCNFTPLDEEMQEYCGDDCIDDSEVCWQRFIERSAEKRLAELGGDNADKA